MLGACQGCTVEGPAQGPASVRSWFRWRRRDAARCDDHGGGDGRRDGSGLCWNRWSLVLQTMNFVFTMWFTMVVLMQLSKMAAGSPVPWAQHRCDFKRRILISCCQKPLISYFEKPWFPIEKCWFYNKYSSPRNETVLMLDPIGQMFIMK